MVFKVNLKKNKLISFALIFIIGISISGCKEDTNKKLSRKSKIHYKTVTLIQEWFPYSGYAGEVMAINETAHKNGLDIKLNAGSDEIDPVKMVISGEDDFGVASADKVISANERGANLVVIGVINYSSPTCYISKKEKNINKPKDFEGHKIGILTGTNTEFIYKALVNKLKLDKTKLKEVDIPFDLGTFITDSYDVRPAFVYDEPVTLDEKKIKYNLIKPVDYDIHFLGTVYFTTKENIKNNPKIVQSFVNALAEGWEKALKNPSKAIEYLKKYDSNINVKREYASLQKGLSYFEGQDKKVLYAKAQEWEKMVVILKELKVIKTFDFNKSVDQRFINKYHQFK
ncbi:ABC transporter substrate-binding protein [Flavobacterium sp.]|jgi:NitT/TauT family transport system substrate-binding protein|uniref:ABC transporter substrate-binding protein n=1 Tax=Flavobacterium sp. TaxID=239 RepID=UPI0037BF3378